MPTFLNMITATIYGSAGVWDAKNGGWNAPTLYSSPSYQAFPKNGLKFIQISPAMTITNQGVSVTLNSVIEIFPTGLGYAAGLPGPQRLLSDSTFTNLYNQGA